MCAPQLKRLALLGEVGRAIVDTGDASLGAADVVDDRLYNMGLREAALANVRNK